MKIGLIGKAGAGKDTAAQIISQHLLMTHTAFAKPLHNAVVHIWGSCALSRKKKEEEQIFGESVFDWFYDWHIGFMSDIDRRFGVITQDNLMKVMSVRDVFSDKRGNIVPTITPRRFMQLYGTEYWRKLKPSVFIDIVRACDENCVISDVRFTDEVSVCDKLIVIRRNGIDPVEQHTSEQLADSFLSYDDEYEGALLTPDDKYIPYIVVDNNGTIDDLGEKLKRLVTTE